MTEAEGRNSSQGGKYPKALASHTTTPWNSAQCSRDSTGPVGKGTGSLQVTTAGATAAAVQPTGLYSSSSGRSFFGH